MSHTYVAEPRFIWSWGDGYPCMRPGYEVKQWLLANVGKEMVYSSKWGWKGQWRMEQKDGCNYFVFADPKKAVMYKLVWGGA